MAHCRVWWYVLFCFESFPYPDQSSKESLLCVQSLGFHRRPFIKIMAPVSNKQTNPAQKGGKTRRRRPVGTHFSSMARFKVATVDVIHFYTASVCFCLLSLPLSFPSIYGAFKFCACYKNNVASLSSHVVDPPDHILPVAGVSDQ